MKISVQNAKIHKFAEQENHLKFSIKEIEWSTCLISHKFLDKMKKYTDPGTGKTIVEVDDLSYLSDRGHRYNWFQRHFHHHRLRLALKNAEIVIVPDAETAVAVHYYYFVPKENILIRPA